MQGELNLANKQDARADQMFNLTLPGMKTALSHYQDLASGDSNAIFRAVAPSVSAIDSQTKQAKQNITNTMPRGGEQNLALEEADISKGSAISNVVNQSYEGAFPALATLAGQGVGLSNNEVANAIAAFGGASNTAGNLANQQAAGKESMLGFIGSLAGSGMEMGAAFA